jgi:hypothetical protein
MISSKFLQISFEVVYKVFDKSNSTIINVTTNFSVLVNGSTENPAGNFIFDQLLKILPSNLLHRCPYQGEVKLYGFTLTENPDIVAYFRIGSYFTKMVIYDTRDENILTVKMFTEIYNSRQKI